MFSTISTIHKFCIVNYVFLFDPMKILTPVTSQRSTANANTFSLGKIRLTNSTVSLEYSGQ